MEVHLHVLLLILVYLFIVRGTAASRVHEMVGCCRAQPVGGEPRGRGRAETTAAEAFSIGASGSLCDVGKLHFVNVLDARDCVAFSPTIRSPPDLCGAASSLLPPEGTCWWLLLPATK